MLAQRYWQMQQTIALDPVLQAVVDAVVAQSLTAAGVRAELAPELAEVSAIKIVSDSFVFSAPGVVDANVKQMNGAAVIGSGTASNLWRGE